MALADAAKGPPNLILGIVDNYHFYEISHFLMTLRQAGFAGHACLFAGPGISRRTRARIERFGVELIPYREQFPFIASPHPDNLTALPSPIHIYNYRHFLYYDYLLKHGGRFANVLLTDVKDVVFQKDPFDFAIGDRLHVAMENIEIPIGDCPWTAPWILAGYDPQVLEQVEKEPMSCAGTSLGPVPAVQRYLRAMLGEIVRMKDPVECADQAAHNVLLHRGAFEPVERLNNFEGPVLTVGSEPRYQFDDHQRLVNRDGSVIAVVHQYDRHPELVELFDAKVRGSPLRRLLARAMFRIARKLATLRSAFTGARGRG